MKCPKCGLINTKSAQRCDCGYDFSTGQVKESYLKKSKFFLKYKGVGGWLLFLCISLTILSPLFTLINLIIGYKEFNNSFESFPGLLTIIIFDTIISICLMIFSIYAGIALWTIKPKAVKIAKIYLLFFLGYTIIFIFFLFIINFSSISSENILGENLKNEFRSLAYLIIWYTYLNKSKRVKATYTEYKNDVSSNE